MTNTNYPRHLPRITRDYSRKLVKKYRLPYVFTETGPKLTRVNIESVVLACYESNHPQRLAEEYVLQLFTPLPYSLAPAITYDNERHFFARHNVATTDSSYSRMFPSGSMGVNLTKPLHADKNGAISPELWQCSQADPENRVNVTFRVVTEF